MDTPITCFDNVLSPPGTPPPLTLSGGKKGKGRGVGGVKEGGKWSMTMLWQSLPKLRPPHQTCEVLKSPTDDVCLSRSFENPPDAAPSGGGSFSSRLAHGRSVDSLTAEQVALDNTLSMRKRAAHRIAASLSFDSSVDPTIEGHLTLHAPQTAAHSAEW